MSLITGFICVTCGARYAPDNHWTCRQCGPPEGILDVMFDMDRARQTLTRATLATRTRSHWRYRELLPLNDEFCPTDGNIGWTPIVAAPRLAAALGVARLRLKDDGRNASASFKDRASSVGVAHAMQNAYQEIACASTGNAASSLAHCAAVAGISANIFVPQTVPDGKLAQLLAYGARVFKIRGSYAQAYDLCSKACDKFGWYNRNCAINPFLVEGKKTGGMEVAEQCADEPPDWVAVSVGDGCTVAGIHKGLDSLRQIGIVGWSARILGVQAAGVAPVAAAARTGTFAPLVNGTTYADSINCPVPRNWRKAVQAIRDSNGAFVTVTDDQIMAAVTETGRLTGVFAEPAAAAAVAGVAEARRTGLISPQSSVLAMITGNGLKDIAGALQAVGQPYEINPDLDELERLVVGSTA